MAERREGTRTCMSDTWTWTTVGSDFGGDGMGRGGQRGKICNRITIKSDLKKRKKNFIFYFIFQLQFIFNIILISSRWIA